MNVASPQQAEAGKQLVKNNARVLAELWQQGGDCLKLLEAGGMSRKALDCAESVIRKIGFVKETYRSPSGIVVWLKHNPDCTEKRYRPFGISVENSCHYETCIQDAMETGRERWLPVNGLVAGGIFSGFEYLLRRRDGNVTLPCYDWVERAAAREIVRIAGGLACDAGTLDIFVQECGSVINEALGVKVKFDNQQKAAITAAAQNSFSVIESATGAYRDYTLYGAVYVIKRLHTPSSVIYITSYDTSVISKRLDAFHVFDSKAVSIGDVEMVEFPSGCAVVIEIGSLLTVKQLAKILERIPDGGTCLLAGDPAVYPPDGGVMREIIDSGVVPVTRLDSDYPECVLNGSPDVTKKSLAESTPLLLYGSFFEDDLRAEACRKDIIAVTDSWKPFVSPVRDLVEKLNIPALCGLLDKADELFCGKPVPDDGLPDPWERFCPFDGPCTLQEKEGCHIWSDRHDDTKGTDFRDTDSDKIFAAKYEDAEIMLRHAQTEGALFNAASEMKGMCGYKDSAEQIANCRMSYEEQQAGKAYGKAMRVMSTMGKPDAGGLAEAASLFHIARGYKDSNDNEERCEKMLENMPQKHIRAKACADSVFVRVLWWLHLAIYITVVICVVVFAVIGISRRMFLTETFSYMRDGTYSRMSDLDKKKTADGLFGKIQDGGRRVYVPGSPFSKTGTGVSFHKYTSLDDYGVSQTYRYYCYGYFKNGEREGPFRTFAAGDYTDDTKRSYGKRWGEWQSLSFSDDVPNGGYSKQGWSYSSSGSYYEFSDFGTYKNGLANGDSVYEIKWENKNYYEKLPCSFTDGKPSEDKTDQYLAARGWDGKPETRRKAVIEAGIDVGYFVYRYSDKGSYSYVRPDEIFGFEEFAAVRQASP